MIQLEQQQHGEFVVVGWVGVWLTPTTYIQLAGAGSTKHQFKASKSIKNITQT